MPISILMPALSPTMEAGTLAKWLVKEGDKVSSGDVIAEIETDKATMEVESIDEGTVGRILVEEGTADVPVNETIALLLEEGEDESALEDAAAAKGGTQKQDSPPAQDATTDKAPDQKAQDAPSVPKDAERKVQPEPGYGRSAGGGAAAKAPAAGTHDGERIFASPLARRIAAQNDLDLAALDGSGPHGRIVKRDVEAAIAGGGARKAPAREEAQPRPGAPAPAPAEAPAQDYRSLFEDGSYEEVELDKMRRTIARRLTASKRDIPHYYLTIDCRIDALLAMRKELNARGDDYKISVNDFVIRACALALKKVPEANASWAETHVLRHRHADISMAVALDGGLITPIIRKADTKGLATIANEAKDLATRARERKLSPQEYEGGSFSVSNLGMYGIRHFTAVINPPQAAILAVGAGERRPIVGEDGALTTATVMTVTLSCDHRVIDGALGARLLQAFKGYIEEPLTMLL